MASREQGELLGPGHEEAATDEGVLHYLGADRDGRVGELGAGREERRERAAAKAARMAEYEENCRLTELEQLLLYNKISPEAAERERAEIEAARAARARPAERREGARFDGPGSLSPFGLK